MLSHTCPAHIVPFIQEDVQLKSRYPISAHGEASSTNKLLERLFDAHQPAKWCFGHYHHDWHYRDFNMDFHCVGELSFLDIHKPSWTLSPTPIDRLEIQATSSIGPTNTRMAFVESFRNDIEKLRTTRFTHRNHCGGRRQLFEGLWTLSQQGVAAWILGRPYFAVVVRGIWWRNRLRIGGIIDGLISRRQEVNIATLNLEFAPLRSVRGGKIFTENK